ncbi:MAG: DNA primase noncatalytic subunit PriX [Candidatus Aenigmatarchaeota archaeon]
MNLDNWLGILRSIDSEIKFQVDRQGKWVGFGELDSMPINRTLAVNEIVFDLDGDDWNSCRELAHYLEAVFGELNIPFLRYSSGRWLHYHVFIDFGATMPNEIWIDWFRGKSIHIDQLKEFLRVFKIAIFDFISFFIENDVTGAHIDKQIMYSKRHMIRFEGSLNEKTLGYKTLLEKLPDDFVVIRDPNKVNVPTKIDFWTPSDDFLYTVYAFMKERRDHYSELIEPPFKISETEKKSPPDNKAAVSRKKPSGRRIWIEEIRPLPDGRKRVVDMILLPYYANILKYDDEKCFERVKQWLGGCEELRHVSINPTYIKSKIRYVRNRKLLPLSKKNLSKYFESDLVETILGRDKNEKES